MERKSLHINGSNYDAVKVMKALLDTKENWKITGLEFLLQLLDASEFPVKFKTSGTTGTPKEILFSKKQIWESAANSCRFFNIQNDDVVLLCLPAEYVAGRMMIARAISAKAKLIWYEPSLYPELDSKGINFAAFTPAQVSNIISKSETQFYFEKIHTVIIGGGEIPFELEKELTKFSNSIYATYGMTETLTHVAVREIGEKIYKSVYPDAIFSVNENACLEILIPFISEEKLITHDVVELIDKHSFIWKGRLDNVINSGGVKIYAEEIEHKIIRGEILNENRFYVTSGKDELFGEVPVIVMLKDEYNGDVATLLPVINGLLNKYEHVKHVYIFDKFDFTNTGKLKRQRF